MKITIYSLPDCVQCRQTKVMLDREKINYNAIDLSNDEEAMDKVKELG